MKYYYLILKRMMLLALLLSAFETYSKQKNDSFFEITVKGTIINENHEPVLSTVIVKGSKNATTTNLAGQFTLNNVKADAVLIISGVNIETFEVEIKGRNDMGSIIARSKVLKEEEIVIVANTGYYSSNPNEINGSVVVIDNKTLNQQLGSNILKRLDGVSSGLMFNVGKSNNNPQNKTNISIRGISTIRGPLDPLIVLDGFVYEGDLDNINPNDVENITILKDAAATSIWGSRAGNGVIVIVSKKGNYKKKMQLGLNSNIIFTNKPNLFYLPQMSSSDYIDFEELLFNDGYFNDQIMYSNFLALPPSVEVFLNRREGKITSSDSTRMINSLKSHDIRDDYRKFFYKKSTIQQYSASLRGGDEKNAYLFSIAYNKNNGELHNTSHKINFRFDENLKIGKNVQLNFGSFYTNSEDKAGRTGYGGISIAARQIPYIDMKNPVPTIYRNEYIDTLGMGKLLDWKYYPLEDYKYYQETSNLQEIFTYLGLNYKVSKVFNFDFKYQFQKQQSDNNNLFGAESFYAKNLINLYSQLDRETGIVKYIIPNGDINMFRRSITKSKTARLQFNYDQQLLNHRIIGIMGAEAREAESLGNAFTAYGYNSDPLRSGNVDYVNPYPTFINGGLQNIPGGPSFTSTNNRFISTYMNFNYTYRNRYSFSTSARRDGSNVFGVKINDKWKPLWSVGGGWLISDEPFYELPIIPYLRVKMTYGYSGNVDVSKSGVPVARYLSNSRTTGFPVARVSTINDPMLRWEQSRQINIATDFSFRNQIISGSVDFYLKKGTDLYGESTFDYTTFGNSFQISKNIAGMKGHGIDIVIKSYNINKVFKWNTTLLFNYNESKTTSFFGPTAQKVTSLLGAGKSIMPVVGYPLYGIVAYAWGGLDEFGNPQGFIDGKKSADYYAMSESTSLNGLQAGTIKYIGSGTPKYFGSLINTFSWNQFSLSINLAYKFSYFFIKPSLNYYLLINQGIGNKEYSQRWQKPGDEMITNVPSLNYPNNISMRDDFYSLSEVNVLKADHIRIQFINLTYSITNKAKKDYFFKDSQIYTSASNVGVLWRKDSEKLDPDYPGSLPPSFSLAFGIRANF